MLANISKRTLSVYWVPVLLMLAVIGIESTNLLSSAETGSVLLRIANWVSSVFMRRGVDAASFEEIHGILRKLGHLTGYGILCALTFRALRGTARASLSRIENEWTWLWQSVWLGYALLITVVVAASDEMHQAMLDSRTGSFRDVLIDMSGGLIALLLIYVSARRKVARQSGSVARPQSYV